MPSRTRRRALACAAALTCVVATAGLSGCGDGAGGNSYALAIAPLGDAGPRGQGNLTQAGTAITGALAIGDLDAGVAYALELRGRAGETLECATDAGPAAEVLVRFPDFTAGDGGDADIEVDVAAAERTLRAGTILIVHAGPQGIVDYGVTSDEPLACAELR